MKTRNHIYLIVFIFILLSCKIKDGPINTFYKNGNKKVEGYILNNQKHGTWKYYGEDGIIEFEINYKNGKRFGKYIHYCPNGQINNINYYDSNEVHTGKSYNYFCNGQLRAVLKYKKGHYDSTQCFYYESGTPEYILNYENGKQTGCSYYFKESGDTSRIEFYDNDNLVWIKVF